ncbi:MAG TPA: GNAT family N-acetyltransferase [Thermoanaerobaculia bacterium]|nr:GNAT family N-acetyltransferase [Thermoanaerobaculia bacterium]
MRGQRLFVRPIEPGDADAVRSFLEVHAKGDAVPACGLIGKLLGELVAVMIIDLAESNGVRVDDLIVVPELRRKRIGRVMMNELEALAAKMERDWLIADGAGNAREFLRRVGFTDEGSRMVRRVAR